MKSIDLLVGIKAEQTLRDVVRAATEESTSDSYPLELCPIGKKDWIAGQRLSEPIRFGEVEQVLAATTRHLLELRSHQRIRRDSIRIYAVPKPVPVFMDSPPTESTPPAPPEESATTQQEVECPACGASVHRYNIRYDPWGQMVGCFLCRSTDGGSSGSPSSG